jgi:hypothetical protein
MGMHTKNLTNELIFNAIYEEGQDIEQTLSELKASNVAK